jgi:hypothetical protein
MFGLSFQTGGFWLCSCICDRWRPANPSPVASNPRLVRPSGDKYLGLLSGNKGYGVAGETRGFRLGGIWV